MLITDFQFSYDVYYAAYTVDLLSPSWSPTPPSKNGSMVGRDELRLKVSLSN